MTGGACLWGGGGGSSRGEKRLSGGLGLLVVDVFGVCGQVLKESGEWGVFAVISSA